MKKPFKIFKLLAILLFAFYSCHEEDMLIENVNKSYELKTSRISINQVINEIDSKEIHQTLQEKKYLPTQSNSLLRSSDSIPYFIKKEKDDELTTYILNINSYSQFTPYFLKFIITKNKDETERIGFLKYIPDNQTTVLDLATFTGECQILDINFELTATSNYIDGIKQDSTQNNTANRVTCTGQIIITEVKCSHSGVHGVGETCEGGLVNDAHYLVSVFRSCTGRPGDLVQIIEDTNPENSGGGTFSASIFLNPFLQTLTEDQLLVYHSNPSIETYLVNNLIVEQIPNYNPLLGGNPTRVVIKPEAEEFVTEFLNSTIGSGLSLDFEKSLNSPANIDFSAIDQNTLEGQQFTWIYSKLMESDIFKQMFTETFQVDDPKINVKFEVTNEGIPSGANGICRIQGSDGNWHNTIKIRKSIFGEDSNLSIAKTILHECIHAYLNIKKIDSNLGTTIAELNGLDLGELLGTFGGGFGGVPVANGTLTQHDFMFNYMIPVFTNVLADLKEKLISSADINVLDTTTNGYFYNPETGLNEPFNWNDLFYFLSLNGLQGSIPFITLYPNGSVGYEKWRHYGYDMAIINLTKTQF